MNFAGTHSPEEAELLKNYFLGLDPRLEYKPDQMVQGHDVVVDGGQTPPPAPIAPPELNSSGSRGIPEPLPVEIRKNPFDTPVTVPDDGFTGGEAAGLGLSGLGDAITNSFGPRGGQDTFGRGLNIISSRKKATADAAQRKIENALKGNEEARAETGETRAAAAFKTSQAEAQHKLDEIKSDDDPTTPEAAALRLELEKILPSGKGQFDNVGAGGLRKMLTPFEKVYAIDEANKLHRETAAERATTAADKKDTKDQDKQARIYKDEQTRLDKITSRGGGEYGRQDQKVNAAIHARKLIEGAAAESKDGAVHLNQITTPELALALSSIVSNNSGGGNLETFRAMQPQTLYGDIKSKIGHITGQPTDVLPKVWVHQLTNMLDRQGVVSEKLRDKYFDQMIRSGNPYLNEENRQRLAAEKRGNSYRDEFNIPDAVDKEPAAGGDNAGKVKVSNGSEMFWIDPADEADSAKDGFKRVQ